MFTPYKNCRKLTVKDGLYATTRGRRDLVKVMLCDGLPVQFVPTEVPGALWKPTDPGIYEVQSYAVICVSEEDANVYLKEDTDKTERAGAPGDTMEVDTIRG